MTAGLTSRPWTAGARALLPALFLLCAGSARAADVPVAVAANFTEPAKEIAVLFEQKTGHRAVLSFGATGQFFAQISQGAPFEVFFSADQTTPRKAIDDGFAVAGTSYTYAVGKLVLFSAEAGLTLNEQALREGRFDKVAIANPASAPYGAAAVETMKAVGAYDALAPKIVQGANINQTYQFVDTGNARVGFVALSQVITRAGGSRWIVPQNLYAPIKQDAVLLKRGENSEAAKAFLAFVRSPDAIRIIETFGYAID